MYVRLTHSKKSRHPTLQIVKGIREGKKVKQKIIASLGVIKDLSDVKKLGRLLNNLTDKLEKAGLPRDKIAIKNLVHQKTVYDGFGMVVDRLMELTGFRKIIQKNQGRRKFSVEKIVELIIAQRMHLPSSKLRTYERQGDHGFQEIDLQHIYRTLDAIQDLGPELQKQAYKTACNYSVESMECFFFDVTTLYFESVTKDELKNFGFSKDHKHHIVQIVLALVVNSEGIPLAYKVFRGNLTETKTLIPVLKALRNQFSISNATVVCDRGMASRANIEALQQTGFRYIVASKLRTMPENLKLNDLTLFDPLPGQEKVQEDKKIFVRRMPHPQYKETQLIITYNPSRANKDKKDREQLLEKLTEKISKCSENSSVKRVISNSGYKKYLNVGKGSCVTINEETIRKDEAWDGFHGLAVSDNAGITINEALERYHELWHVEEAFRVAKTTLKTRPVFHWKPHRIESHILLCFINLFFERFLELLLRKKGKHLTPDRIQYALSTIHTLKFEELGSKMEGKIYSVLSEDAKDILETLEICTERTTQFNRCCG